MLNLPRLAISNQAFDSAAAVLDFCRAHSCDAVEYTFCRSAREIEKVREEITGIELLLQSGLQVRYHLAFSSMELGHPDPLSAKVAGEFHGVCLDLVAALGGKYITLHVGLDAAVLRQLDYAAAMANLADLVALGEKLGVTVCLENLRRGRSGDPLGYRALLDASGALATLDIGHALAQEDATGIAGYALEFIECCKERICGAHVYEIEKVHERTGIGWHKAPQDLELLRPVLDKLITCPNCQWWLVELTDQREVAETLGLLRGYLYSKQRQMTISFGKIATE